MVWKPEPELVKRSNPHFDVELSLHCEKDGCAGFNLFLENKTGRDLEIDWGRTFYLSQHKESGGFVFEGIILRDKNLRKAPDIVVAYGVLSRKLIPESLLDPARGSRFRNMGPGDHGMLLTVIAGGQVIQETLNLNLLGLVMEERVPLGFQDSKEAPR